MKIRRFDFPKSLSLFVMTSTQSLSTDPDQFRDRGRISRSNPLHSWGLVWQLIIIIKWFMPEARKITKSLSSKLFDQRYVSLVADISGISMNLRWDGIHLQSLPLFTLSQYKNITIDITSRCLWVMYIFQQEQGRPWLRRLWWHPHHFRDGDTWAGWQVRTPFFYKSAQFFNQANVWLFFYPEDL